MAKKKTGRKPSSTKSRAKKAKPTVSQRVQIIEKVCERVSAGQTITASFPEVVEEAGVDITWNSLVRWTRTHDTKETKLCREMLRESKELRIDAWADEILDLPDSMTFKRSGRLPTNEEISVMREQLKARMFLLEKLAPNTYGKNPQPDIAETAGRKLLVIREDQPDASRVPSKTGRRRPPPDSAPSSSQSTPANSGSRGDHASDTAPTRTRARSGTRESAKLPTGKPAEVLKPARKTASKKKSKSRSASKKSTSV